MFDLFLPCRLLLGRRKLAGAAAAARGREVESERNITARGNGERTEGVRSFGRWVGHVNWREVKWLWEREGRKEGGKEAHIPRRNLGRLDGLLPVP